MVAMPTRNHIRVCTLLLIMGLGAACVLAKDNKKEAEALVAKAQELSDIRCDGCPAFRLWGRVRVFEASGKEAAGLYAMTWVSQGQWGEDVEIPSVRQTRVRKGDKRWRDRNLPSPTLRLFQFLNPVDLHEELKSKADASVKKLRDRKEGAVRLKCVKAEARGGADFEFCCDTATGLMANSGNVALTTKYLDYAPFGSKWYPRRIQLVVKGRPDMEISIEELVPLNPQEAISLEVPTGSREFPTCDSPVPPKILSSVPPVYPEASKRARVAGVVRIIGEVDTLGRIQNVSVVESPDATLGNAAADAVSKWRYEPAHCDGTTVPQEIELDFNFEMRQ